MNPERTNEPTQDGASQIMVPTGMSVYTGRLINALKAGSPGDKLSDASLKDVCGKETNVNGDGYSYLQTAIRYCAKHLDVVWQRVRGEGYLLCQTGEGIRGIVTSDVSRIRKRANRDLALVSAASRQAMDNDETRLLNTLAAQVGAVVVMTSPKATKRLDAMPEKQEPDMSLMLAAFEKK